MAFKPYCTDCRTWHTEREGHIPCDQMPEMTDWGLYKLEDRFERLQDLPQNVSIDVLDRKAIVEALNELRHKRDIQRETIHGRK